MKAIYFVKSDLFVVATEDNQILYKVHNTTHAEIEANLPEGVMLTWDELEAKDQTPMSSGNDETTTK